MAGKIANVHQVIADRSTKQAAWVVVATFVAVEGQEPRCVDYRVRVIGAPQASFGEPEPPDVTTVRSMRAHAISAAEIEALGDFPAAGIPRYVFEEASQGRLLDGARRELAKSSDAVNTQTRNVLNRVKVDRAGRARTGRPPKHDIVSRLRILADIEAEYAAGTRGARAVVAKRHYVSEAWLRDQLHWARHIAEPQLFTSPGRGKVGGQLTDAARRLLSESGE